MNDSPVLAPVEQTYSEEHLKLVESVEPGVDLGWARTVREPHLAVGRDAVDERLWAFDEHVEVPLTVPKPHDRFTGWAARTGPVLDQEFTPHCVTFSGASLRVMHERKEHRRGYAVQAHGWYDETKASPGEPWPGQDGTGIPYAAEVARTTGVLMDDPRSRRDDPGRRFRIKNYVAVESVDAILMALELGPVWFGTDVDRGIFTPQQITFGNGAGEFMLPPPNTHTQVGGHAMLAVGFWRSLDALLVKQSWGADYGGARLTPRGPVHGGFFWMPLDYFRADNYYWDAWAVDDDADPFIA